MTMTSISTTTSSFEEASIMTIQKQMTRADYNALPEVARKLVDAVRLIIAEDAAKRDGMSIEDALGGMIDLHEAGYLTLVEDEDGIGMAACVPIGDGLVEDDPKKWPRSTVAEH
jgi:hypothetical protein